MYKRQIYNNVKDKFTEILNYLGGLKDKFLQKGHEMIDGLITGIADKKMCIRDRSMLNMGTGQPIIKAG